MTSVLTPVRSGAVPPTTLIPFSLWSAQGQEASVLAKAALPNLRAWLAQAQRVDIQVDPTEDAALATLTPPHERAWAQAMGWPVVDGCVPWAARAAAKAGLCATPVDEGWAFITLCNWHVSNGQVTLGDPADLHMDDATDQILFDAMQGFFAEDGMALHRHQPGQWLAQSPLLVDLPTASLDRVIGRNIDPWLVGGQQMTERISPAAQLLRRLQNEMQMLLYTHPVNEGRGLTINSFWVHGTGRLPTTQAVEEPTRIDALRQSALRQDFMGWLEGWQQVDAQVLPPMLARVADGQAQRLVLCGEHAFHVYDSASPSLWQRVRAHWAPPALDTVLAVRP